MAAQVVTITQDSVEYPLQKIQWVWLSATGGAVSSAASGWYCGKIVKVSLASDSGGTAPTNSYDVTIEDGDGGEYASQCIEFTDFPLDEITLYVIKQDDLWVVLLPSEY